MATIIASRDMNTEELKNISDEGVVEGLFKKHYASLCRTVYKIVKDKDTSEDIVQEVFVKMWNKRKELEINVSVKAYLYRSAINTALNYIGSAKKLNYLEDDYAHLSSNNVQEYHDFKETENHVMKAIDRLPPACKAIFVLSRQEEMSYREIADTLNISIKTVENQMGKALKVLREQLKEYLVVSAGFLLLQLFSKEIQIFF